MNLENVSIAYLMAAASSVGLLWGQIKNIISRIYSVFVVSVEVQGYIGEILLHHIFKNYKNTTLGTRAFTGRERYIRSKSYHGWVAFEDEGKLLTFFDKWKPLFVSAGETKNGESNGKLQLSFIRGTFDIEKMLYKASVEFNEEKHSASLESRRYYVRKVFGSNRKNKNNSEQPDSLKTSDDLDSGNLQSRKPVGYEISDLGSPVSKIPFSDLAYPKHIEEFKQEVVRWKKSEDWHKQKGLPWRFGAGMFGPPGTGKTSFARAIGQDLDMPIHIYDLTTMSNEDLVRAWSNSLQASPCIVLFEDIDRIFDKDQNIKSTKDIPSVTMDCLLNCINGVEPANGILVLVTANDMTKLDPALGVPGTDGKSTRPGRLDRGVYFGALELENLYTIAKRILSDCPEFVEETVKAGMGETGAQFESRCAKIALENFWGKPKVYSAQSLEAEPIILVNN